MFEPTTPSAVSIERANVLTWLGATNFRAVYRVALKQRMALTGLWFLQLPEFQPFVEEKGQILWVTGMREFPSFDWLLYPLTTARMTSWLGENCSGVSSGTPHTPRLQGELN